MIVGVCPPPGNTPDHYQAQGQLTRFTRHFQWYTQAGHQLVVAWGGLYRRELRGCDVVRATSLRAGLSAALSRKPYLVSYGADYEAINRIHGRPVWKIRMVRQLVFRTARVILCPSASLTARLKQLFPRAPLRYHPNWVDTDLFRYRERLGRLNKTVLYVGRQTREKNLDRLREACRRAGLSLRIVGAPSPVDWLDLPAVMDAHDLFAMVSLSDTAPKALYEAMACGLNCVVSDRILEGAVYQGMLWVEPEDIQSIVNGLVEAFTYSRLGKVARQRICQTNDVRILMPQEVALCELL